MEKFKTQIYFVLLVCSFLSLQSCISRLRRPEISGVIVDYDKNPIGNCKVGEVLTDENGKFKLAEERYNAFFLTEIFAMEAPPLMVNEIIEKEGFEKDAITMFHRYGGGRRKGAKTTVDTIFLKKINQVFDISALLKSSVWKLAFNKNADTIYLVKNGFKEWCKTDKCTPFYGEFQALTDNYTYSGKNLPAGMIRRTIDLKFNREKSPLNIYMICQYISTFKGPNRSPDTTNTSGSYRVLNNKKMILDAGNIKQISGSFNISDVDLYQMKLTKIKDF